MFTRTHQDRNAYLDDWSCSSCLKVMEVVTSREVWQCPNCRKRMSVTFVDGIAYGCLLVTTPTERRLELLLEEDEDAGSD